MVDDGSHAAHKFIVLIGKVIFDLAEIEGGVAVLAQRVVLIVIK